MNKTQEKNNDPIIYVVYDSKAERYIQPRNAMSRGGLIRSFQDQANDKESPLGQHPEDYILYEIGTFSDITGEITLYKSPVSLGKGLDYVKQGMPNDTNIQKSNI